MRLLVIYFSDPLRYLSAFVLIPGIGYGAASVCPQLLTMLSLLCPLGRHDFSQLQIVLFWGLWKGISGRGGRGAEVAEHPQTLTAVAFAIAGLLGC